MSSNAQPEKTTGQYHSLKGTAVEAVGNLTGSTDWQTSGQKEHAEGETEVKAAQVQGYAEGASDSIVGYAKSIVGAVTGDKTQQTEGNVQKEKGNVQKEINKPST